MRLIHNKTESQLRQDKAFVESCNYNSQAREQKQIFEQEAEAQRESIHSRTFRAYSESFHPTRRIFAVKVYLLAGSSSVADQQGVKEFYNNLQALLGVEGHTNHINRFVFQPADTVIDEYTSECKRIPQSFGMPPKPKYL